MGIASFLENDKDRLIAGLDKAESLQDAGRILESEMDQLLLKYNEGCASQRQRSSSSYMMQAARTAVPLLYSQGTPRVWEYDEAPQKAAGVSGRSRVFLFAGVICGIISVVVPALSPAALSSASLPVSLVTLAAALALMFAAGYFRARPAAASGKKQQKVEIPVSSEKIYRTLHTAALVMDQNLSDIQTEEEWEKKNPASANAAEGPFPEDLELFAQLLEAEYSNDGQYAIEKLGTLKYYLHRKGVELIDYSSGTAQMFDVMPSKTPGTIRPALVSSGRLLKKGLAAGSLQEDLN